MAHWWNPIYIFNVQNICAEILSDTFLIWKGQPSKNVCTMVIAYQWFHTLTKQKSPSHRTTTVVSLKK